MAANFMVTGQAETFDLDTGSRPIKSMVVTIETLPSKIVATVSVPLTEYDVTTVATLLAERATTIEAVEAL